MKVRDKNVMSNTGSINDFYKRFVREELDGEGRLKSFARTSWRSSLPISSQYSG